MVMKKIINWFKNNRDSIIRNSFLIPILLVVAMSISHVVSWYGLGNPISWAIYLSVAIEIFALASVAAASINIKKGSIWFLFGLVTFIQIIGNIFYEYQFIDINSAGFKSWVELIQPLFFDWDLIDHRRLLATIQGGTLPIMSLTALHFYIKFTERKYEEKVKEVTSDNSILPKNENSTTLQNDITNDDKESNSIVTDEEIDNASENEVKPPKEVEYIDEDSILNEESNSIEKEESSNLSTSNDTNMSKNLNTLEVHGNKEKSKNKSYHKDEKVFGPPHINNIN